MHGGSAMKCEQVSSFTGCLSIDFISMCWRALRGFETQMSSNVCHVVDSNQFLTEQQQRQTITVLPFPALSRRALLKHTDPVGPLPVHQKQAYWTNCPYACNLSYTHTYSYLQPLIRCRRSQADGLSRDDSLYVGGVLQKGKQCWCRTTTAVCTHVGHAYAGVHM